MRAVTFKTVSGSIEPTVDDVVEPSVPAGSQILVRVAASSINGSDLGLVRSGSLMAWLSRKARPGFDISGVVAACGEAVTAFTPGDRVMALLGHRGGGQGQLVLVPQRSAARVPDFMTDGDAAALPLAGLTALQALRGRAGIHRREGMKVLVNGAAGGIGSFAVQLAKNFGAHVTAITSNNRQRYLHNLGADTVLDRHETDLLGRGLRYDVVLDVPGSFHYRTVRPILTPQGMLVSTRPIAVDTLRMLNPASAHRRTQRFTVVTTRPPNQDLAYLSTLIETGRIRVPLDRSFPLDQVADAYRHAMSGNVRGKTVLIL
ncbi:NADP-dependent oxidoreductase [Arthrobacter sp. HLT1-21]